MTGKQSRDKGHRWERDVARHLTLTLDVEVRTGRDGRGGAQTPGDLQYRDEDGRWWPGVYSWELELKDVTSNAVPTWLAQARDAARHNGLDWFAVVSKVRQRRVGEAFVFLPAGMLADFLEFGAPSECYSLSDYVSLSLDAWLEVVR